MIWIILELTKVQDSHFCFCLPKCKWEKKLTENSMVIILFVPGVGGGEE